MYISKFGIDLTRNMINGFFINMQGRVEWAQRANQVCVISIQYDIEILAGHVYVVHVNYEQQRAENRPLWHTSTYIGSVGVCSIKVNILFPAMQITLEPV